MAEPVSRPASYDDLLAVPEPLVAKILGGELHTHPRPSPRHASIASLIGGSLVNPFWRGRGGPGGWWIIDEPEIHLGEDVLVPGLAGWRRDRLPELPEKPFFELAPDWVCEILSPSTARSDRVVKLPIYASRNVGHVWVIDPASGTLEVYEVSQGSWLLLATYAQAQTARVHPFEAIELRLDDILTPA